MNFAEIEKKVHKALEDGIVHHLYDNEIQAYSLLTMHPDDLKKLAASISLADSIQMYADLLGPTQIRSIKNGLISYLTLVCRGAIKNGVDPEFSYALSDYYINYLETLSTIEELTRLTVDIMLHYNDLVYRSEVVHYSKTTDTALRYMKQHLYGKCSIQEVAAFVGLEPHYFSSVFRRETGKTPSGYLSDIKLKEARRLLGLPGNTITYVASILGFSDSAHFSKRFKQYYSLSPREYKKIQREADQ